MADRGRATAVGSPIYGLGVLGAWVWFWQQADGFWWHLLAVLEGIIWPAFVVYHGLAQLD
jgi:hypothetical protein